MRRPLRILLNAATVLSLLLCVSTIVVLVRSYFVSDEFEWFHRENPFERRSRWDPVGYTREIEVARGGIRLTASHEFRSVVEGWYRLGTEFNWTHSSPAVYPLYTFSDPLKHTSYSALGIQVVTPKASEDEKRGDIVWVRSVTIPLSAVACFTLILPLLRVRSWRVTRLRRMRQRSGACPRCGYDLRATPDRCPECGTVSANVTPDAPPRVPADRSG
jgi:hypothetical protein